MVLFGGFFFSHLGGGYGGGGSGGRGVAVLDRTSMGVGQNQ